MKIMAFLAAACPPTEDLSVKKCLRQNVKHYILGWFFLRHSQFYASATRGDQISFKLKENTHTLSTSRLTNFFRVSFLLLTTALDVAQTAEKMKPQLNMCKTKSISQPIKFYYFSPDGFLNSFSNCLGRTNVRLP